MNRKPQYFTVALIFLVFAVISFLTNILNPLIPEVKRSFGLSNLMAGLLPFAFFVAYGVMSIPAGILLDRTGAKLMTVMPFLLACIAAFSFALFPRYGVYLVTLFVITSYSIHYTKLYDVPLPYFLLPKRGLTRLQIVGLKPITEASGIPDCSRCFWGGSKNFN